MAKDSKTESRPPEQKPEPKHDERAIALALSNCAVVGLSLSCCALFLSKCLPQEVSTLAAALRKTSGRGNSVRVAIDAITDRLRKESKEKRDKSG